MIDAEASLTGADGEGWTVWVEIHADISKQVARSATGLTDPMYERELAGYAVRSARSRSSELGSRPFLVR